MQNNSSMSHPMTPLLLRILDGRQKGTRVPLRDGLTIGRKEGDLLIKDPKLSVRHARVEWKNGEWVISDLGSSNKIKVDGTRYAEVVLYPGLEFMIGSTSIEVLERPKVSLSEGTQSHGVFEFTGSIEIPAEALTWKEILLDVLSKVRTQSDLRGQDSQPAPLKPFPATLKLEFLSGPQHGTTWHIGYGPREVGAKSFDLALIDEAAADSCFHLDTAGGKVLIRAVQGAAVRINGKSAPQESIELRSGDRIEIGKTRIRASIG